METLNLYEFYELNETAKKRAISGLRERCYEENSNLDVGEACETKYKIMELAGVVPSYYGCVYADPHVYYNKTLEEQFTLFNEKVKSKFIINTIFDSMIKDIIDKWDFSKENDYLDTIGYIIIEFEKAVTSNNNLYKEDENVINYINANDSFRFLEDGRFFDL